MAGAERLTVVGGSVLARAQPLSGRRLLAAGTGTVLLAVAALLWSSAPGETPSHPALAQQSSSWLTLSVSRRFAISRAQGYNEERYWARSAGNRFALRNRAQGIAALVGSGGIAVTTREGLRFTIGPVSVRRTVGGLAPANVGVLHVARSEISIAGPELSESLANGPLAIEQGFTLTHRPAGEGALILAQPLRGAVTAQVQGHGQTVLIKGSGGSVVYSGLAVLDANGRAVSARLGVASGALTITIDDARAAYPLHIDPVLTAPDSTVSTPSATTITYGQSATDTLTVTGSSGTPTGSVSFYECGPTGLPVSESSCSSTAKPVGAPAPLSGSAGSASATSDSFTPLSVGTYCFYAVYGGDSTYQSSSDATSDGCLKVTRAPLTITASGGAFPYGGTAPTITAGYGGLVNGDLAPTTPPTCSTTATSTSAVGGYLATCAGASDPNYAISYEPGLVNVTPAPLTLGVTGSETYGGSASFKLDGDNSGFVSPDTTSVLSGSLVGCSSSAHGASAGSYSSTISGCTGLSGANYSIAYQDDGFTITKAPLTVTASSASMTYGGSVPSITPIYSGLVNGDSAPTTTPICSTTATSSSPVGSSYTSSCIGAADPNYTVTPAGGNVTINQAPLQVYVTGTQTYGSSTQSFSVVGVTGLVNGDHQSSVLTNTNLLACSSSAQSTWAVGMYYMTISGCSGPTVSANYLATYIDDGLSVTPAPLTVEVQGSETYGGSPSFKVKKYDGLVNGDATSVVSGSLRDCASSADGGAVGSYPSTIGGCAGLGATNYAISYQDEGFTISVAPLTITAASPGMTYGGSVPAIGALYSGLTNGDTPSSLTTKPLCTSSAPGTPAAGGYATSCSGAVDANYAITYVQGTLTVAPAPLLIVASSTSMTYGGTVPTITPIYSGLVNSDAVPATAPTCSTTATATSAAGNIYASSCTGAVDANYAITEVPGTVTVTPAPLTITASSPSMTYGGTAPPISASYSTFVNGQSPSSLTGTLTCQVGATTPYTAGNHQTHCSGLSSTNYAITYVEGALTVMPAPLLITASSASMTYGGSVPTITPGYSGLVNSDSAPANAPTCGTSTTSSSPVGGYLSSCTGASDPNYVISYAQGAVTVSPAPLTVEVQGGETYGGPASFSVKKYDGLVNGDPTTVVYGSLRDCESSADGGAVGSYSGTISGCAGLGATNYAVSYQDHGFTISKAPLTITATSPNMTYGGVAPSIMPIYSGLVNGDLAPSTTPTCSITGTTPYQAGGHITSCSGAADANYTISYQAGSLTVAPAPLLISASGGTMIYGGTVPAITPIYSGLVNSDAAPANAPTCGTVASAASAVGAYASSCSGASDPNYAISYMAGTVTVTPASLTITASSPTMTYGASVPAITPGYSGWAGPDSGPSALSTLPTCFTSATSASAVGSLPATVCTGAVDPNYKITYDAGAVTIDPAALTVTASSPTMTYGGPVPTITPIYSGLVNNDTAPATAPTCSTTAAPTTPVVQTPTTTCTGPSGDGNYTVTYVDGKVTIDRAPLEATIDGTQVYGGTDVKYTVASYSGFVNGESANVITGVDTPSCSTTVGADDGVGIYSLTISACSGLGADNYAPGYSYGTFTVTPATLTITATPNSGTMTYGGPAPTITPDYGGLVNGDAAPATTPTCYTTAGPTSDAGSVLPAICTGALDPNYTIKYVNGSVTVEQAPLTITASSAAILYGGAVPAITPIYSGFVNNDNPGDLTTEATCVPNATSSSSADTYHPTCSGAVDTNYAISYDPGTLTIGPAPLAITVTGSQVYGGTPSFQIPVGGYSGFVNGETASVVFAGQLLSGCATTVTSSTQAGVYPNTITGCGGLTDSNYAISYLDGGFTVTDAQTSSVSALPLASIAIGGSQVDSVVVTGNVVGGAPTGHVRFFVCAVQTLGVTPCATGGTQIGSDIAVTSASADTATASSSAFAPDSGPGTYCLRAQYLGDNNYNPSADGTSDECFTVTQGNSTAAASPSAPSAPIGTPVSDTVSVTGNAVAGPPSGSVSFYACAPGTMPCTSGGTSLGNADLVTNGSATATATSSSFLATNGPGTYCFRVVYGGDANYAGSSDASADQCFTVTKGASLTVSTPGYAAIAAGESDDDSVTVSGNGAGGAPTGSVSFYVCGPGAASCSSTASQLGGVVALAVSGGQRSIASSPYFTPSVAGTYCFYALYSGDANYAGSADSSGCFTLQAASAAMPAPSAAVPSNAFQITGHGFKHGTLHVTVELPGAGAVALVANHGKNAIGSGSASARAAGKLKVSLALSSGGVRALARAIANHKPFQANVIVTFTPTGGSPSSETLHVTLGG